MSFNWYYAGTDPFRQVQTQQLNKLGTSLLALSHTLENLANQAQHSRTLISNLTLDAMSSTSQDESTTLHSTMIPSQQQAQLSESRQQHRIGKRSRRCSRSLTSAACTKVQSVGEQNTQTGQVYSNDPLGLLTAHGRDTNLWHSFLTQINIYDAVPRATIIRGNFIMRINITFEGLRWNDANIFLDNGYKIEPLCGNLPPQQFSNCGGGFGTPPKAPKHPCISDRTAGRGKKNLSPHYHCYLRLRTRQRGMYVRCSRLGLRG